MKIQVLGCNKAASSLSSSVRFTISLNRRVNSSSSTTENGSRSVGSILNDPLRSANKTGVCWKDCLDADDSSIGAIVMCMNVFRATSVGGWCDWAFLKPKMSFLKEIFQQIQQNELKSRRKTTIKMSRSRERLEVWPQTSGGPGDRAKNYID